MQLTALVVVASTALLVGYVVNKIIDNRRHAAREREMGCGPIIRAPTVEPIGIVNMLRSASASRQKKLPEWMEEQVQQLCAAHGRPVGTINLRTPFFCDTIFTVDPQNIQAVLALKFKDFGLGPNRTENFAPLLGNGIFAANGKQWEHSRALLRPQFVRSQVSDLGLEENHVKALMAVLERHLGSDGWTSLVDLQVLFFRLTFDSATEFLFGESVNSQLGTETSLPGGGQGVGFAKAFDSAQHTLSMGARLGSGWWMVHTPRFHRMVREIHAFVDYFVQVAVKKGADGEKTSGEETSGDKEKYVFLHALARDTQDPKELRWQLLNILLAGRDTTASTLGWFFYTLADARYAPIFGKLRAVILDEFGTYSNPRDITFERIKACQYLQWCINECLRMYPIVSVNVRTAQVDTCLPVGGGPDGRDPTYVRKGQDVAYSVHIMQRRKDLWGEDANVFKPERWEHRRPGWDYLPFNGGPRICIGQQFALTEIAYVVIRLMQRVDDMDGSKAGPVKHNLTLTNCPADGVNVRLHFAE
ncbi:Cytochrome P450 52A12 [Tolypocladium paradoxum]|uniref:Cytochrome P450 52A12 n=1 Tax=Tolypocladium paradoxum TaxID=94208 RepID=A0A2S4L4Z4_9HYPO|nr:Cytochrome P450 52A12 [Tolypocladium paradoxum]